MNDLQKLTMRREDVDALEDAADTLIRRDYQEQATRLYAIALRLRTEAGWKPVWRDLGADSNVRELRP